MPSIDSMMRADSSANGVLRVRNRKNVESHFQQRTIFSYQARYIWDLQYQITRKDKALGEKFKLKKLSMEEDVRNSGLKGQRIRAVKRLGIQLTGMQMIELIQFGEELLKQ